MHVILDGFVEKYADVLREPEVLRGWLTGITELIGLDPLAEPMVYRFPPSLDGTCGLTGFVVVMESHASIHTWPELNVLFIDVFSCKDFDLEVLMDYLKGKGFEWLTRVIMDRGVEGNDFHPADLRLWGWEGKQRISGKVVNRRL